MFSITNNNRSITVFAFVGICSITILFLSVFDQMGGINLPALIASSCFTTCSFVSVLCLLYQRNSQRSFPIDEQCKRDEKENRSVKDVVQSEASRTMPVSASGFGKVEESGIAPAKASRTMPVPPSDFENVEESEVTHSNLVFETIEEHTEFFQILETPRFKSIDIESRLNEREEDNPYYYEPHYETLYREEIFFMKDLMNDKKEAWLRSDDIDRYLEYLDVNPKFSFFVKPFALDITIEDIGNKFLNYLKALGKTTIPKIWAFPLNVTNNHWTLVLIDSKKRSVEYYDSKINYGNYRQIEARLKQLASEMTEYDPGIPYQFQQKIKKFLQPDGFQCGIWVLYFLEKRLEYPEIDFNEMDIAKAQIIIRKFRKHAANIIYNMFRIWHKTYKLEKDNPCGQIGSPKYTLPISLKMDSGKILPDSIYLTRERLRDIFAGKLVEHSE